MNIRKVRAELQKLRDQIAAKNPIPEIIFINDDHETREQVCRKLGIDPDIEGLTFFHASDKDERLL